MLQLRLHTIDAERNKLSLEAGARAACVVADGAGYMGLQAQGCTAQELPVGQAQCQEGCMLLMEPVATQKGPKGGAQDLSICRHSLQKTPGAASACNNI